MPYFRLETNLPQNKVPKDLPATICDVLSKNLGKPLNYCVAAVIGDVPISWGGTNESAAQATLLSIGGLGNAQNKKLSKVLAELITNELGIKPDRMYILFKDAEPGYLGYNGTTFGN